MSESMVLLGDNGIYLHYWCPLCPIELFPGAGEAEDIVVKKYHSKQEASDSGWTIFDQKWICKDCYKALLS